MDRWDVLEAARPQLLESFGRAGVVRIEYVVGFVEPYTVGVWLGTATDRQRDALATRPGIKEIVAEVLRASGLEGTDAVFSDVVVQSQETVDREYKGSWFSALR